MPSLGDALIGAWNLSSSTPARQADVDGFVPHKHSLWLHLDRSGDGVETYLKSLTDIPPVAISELLADETRPCCIVFDEGILVNFRGVNLNPGSDPEDMVSIRLWLTEKSIISLRRKKLKAYEILKQMFEAGRGPKKPDLLLARIAEAMVERMVPVVSEMCDMLDEMEEDEQEINIHDSLQELSELRRTILRLRRFLGPQKLALVEIIALDDKRIGKKAQTRLDRVNEITTRLLEELDLLRERAGVLRDHLIHRREEQSNKTLYLLSVIAGIFLPLGFLTGLLGINVGGMPGVDSPYAFWIVCALCVVIGAGQYAFLRWKKLL